MEIRRARERQPISGAGAIADPEARRQILELQNQLGRLAALLPKRSAEAGPLALEVVTGLRAARGKTVLIGRRLIFHGGGEVSLGGERPLGEVAGGAAGGAATTRTTYNNLIGIGGYGVETS